ncbi:hypothetical protein [Streptomyces sp. NPDC002250]|uniref:hypothetical protein n=1 Tax=Streptomyces sp. NPDC002250 TaxID=3364641 RepID=UPI0036C78913
MSKRQPPRPADLGRPDRRYVGEKKLEDHGRIGHHWVGRAPDAHPPFLILEEYLARFELDGLWSNIEILDKKPGV